jgi:hypothetical protein
MRLRRSRRFNHLLPIVAVLAASSAAADESPEPFWAPNEPTQVLSGGRVEPGPSLLDLDTFQAEFERLNGIPLSYAVAQAASTCEYFDCFFDCYHENCVPGGIGVGCAAYCRTSCEVFCGPPTP